MRKKILVLCEAYGGGVKTYVDSIFNHSEKFKECEFTVLVSSERIEDKTKINNEYFIDDNLSFGRSIIKLYKALFNIQRIVKQHKINIIHANSTFAGLISYLYYFFNKNITIIYTPHGYYSLKKMSNFKKKIVQFIERKINKISTKVIHVSKSEEKVAFQSNLVTTDKSIMIFNGTNDPRIKYKKRNSDILTIINLARVDDQKNPYKFIEIAKEVLQKNKKVQFLWAGEGKYLEQIRQVIIENKYEKNIKFIGFSAEKDRLLSQADIYLSSSYYEGLPFSVIEAMSYKLPIVLSDIVGHKDLIRNNGILYNLNDNESIVKYINKIITDIDLYKVHSENSYELYCEKFSIDKMLNELLKVYNYEFV